MDKDTAARLRDRRVPRYFGDDPGFLEIVEFFVWWISHDKKDDLFAIRVDNWFDRKWLGFSGNVPYTFSYGGGVPDFATTQPIWKGLGKRAATTFPPFVPNRIVRETHLKTADGWVSRTGNPERVHPLEKRRSEANLDRKILSSFKNAAFIWFSSRSEANGRGTIMLYSVRDEVCAGFWVSYLRKDRWQVDRTICIDREVLVRQLARLSEEEG